MANHVLPIVARTRRGFPAWVDEQASLGHEPVIPDDASISSSKNGLIIVCGSTGNTVLPIVNSIDNDKAEVLIKFERYLAGSSSFGNVGGAIIFNESKSVDPTANYQFCISSGSSLTYNLYKYSSASGFTSLGGSVGLGSAWQNKDILLRARKELSALKLKAWYEGDPEPTSWGISVTDSTYKLDTIDFQVGSYNQLISIKKLAYATNGDTASFDLPPVVDVMAGTVPNVKNGDIVNIHDLATHNIVDSIILLSSGAWTSSLYNNRPVYARIERANGSEYDFLFAKYGGTYLGGDYPDGSVKDDGVPSAGEISVLYRSDDPILGGATIAKASAPQSGEWRVSGLQPNVPFDVVARKPNRKDVVVSSVIGVPDPDFKFALLGQLGNNNGYLTGLVLAKGSAQPINASFLGTTPYGLQASALVVDGNKINANIPLRDYGDFSFDMRVTDANNKFVDSRVNIVDGQRAPFVDFIGAVNSIDRGNVTTPVTAVIPSSVMPGDILVIGLMRRGSGITISDNNSGVWVLSADVFGSPTYDQGTSIYTRTAKVGDAGKTITVNAPYNGRLIVYLSVYRGKFAPLMVKSGRSGPVRYDSTYSSIEKNIEPIAHSSGFLIRAASNVYAFSDNNALMVISNMTPTGPAFGDPYRLQVAYAHLSKPGTFISTYKTGTSNAGDVIPEASIILDEIRP